MLRDRTLRLQTASLVTAAVALVAGVHCGDTETTGRTRVSFSMVAHASRAEGDNGLGWRITLERAAMAVGPVRWYEGAPLARLLPWLSPSRFALGLAEAHPGHYVPGEALADITSQRAVDLLAVGGTELARGDGVSGDARSAQLELRPPGADLGPTASLLGGPHALVIRGVARRGDAVVRFEGALTGDHRVEGIPAAARLDGNLGRWDLSVDAIAWLERADFSNLPAPSMQGEYVPIGATGQVANALFRGATSGAPYHFTWLPDGRDR